MKSKNEIIIALILLALISPLCASGSTDTTDLNDRGLLLFRSGYVNTDATEEAGKITEEQGSIAYISQSAEDIERYYIVQFTNPVQEAWKQEVTSKGASIFNYVPNNAFVFRMNESVKTQIYSLHFVKWVGEYKPSYKYIPESASDRSIQLSGSGNEAMNIYLIQLFPSGDREKVASVISSLGGDVLSGSGNVLKIQIPAGRLPEIASIEDVSWIEAYKEPVVFNDVAADIINVDKIHTDYKLNGTGQIVAVCDTGLDTGVNDSTMHDDLEGRIISIIDSANDGSPADQNGHGTHVAGSVLGNGASSDRQYSGMAPEARLVFQAVGNSSSYLELPDDLREIFQEAYALEAKVHTDSWGTSSNGAYTIYSQQVDQFMWENPDMLILFSAGNNGEDYDSNGVIDRGSLVAPGTAKNCLTIGASENERGESFGIGPYLIWGSDSWIYKYPLDPIRNDYMASNRDGIAAFSSRGPTEDGRIKPDLVAPGTFIASTRSSRSTFTGWGEVEGNGNYVYMGGTSMSAPIAAGAATLVRQYYTDIEGLPDPSAALLKATLINGAHDMSPGQYGTGSAQEITGRPDSSQGWGRVDIENSIYLQYPGVIRYFDNAASLSTGQQWSESYDIIDTSEPIRATLVWTDRPGNPAVVPQLVNNLDLIVIGPEGTYYGNDGPDITNNVEGIELADPAAGTYTFIVYGTSIPQGPQNFSLVISYNGSPEVFPRSGSYTNDSTTSVHINLTSPAGIDPGSVEMNIDGSRVIASLEDINEGYKIENMTMQPYEEGYHTVKVSALTNTSQQLSYEWTFYVSTEENVIAVHGLRENDVKQEETFDISISNNKLCDFWYSVDNTANHTMENTFGFNATLDLSEGYHNITLFAEDITGYINSTTIDFTVFTSQPVIDSPAPGTIYYLPDHVFAMNGTAGIATGVAVFVNGAMTNSSHPTVNGAFSVGSIPLSDGINIIELASIFNNSEGDYYSSNTTTYLSLGKTFDISGEDKVTLQVPGLGRNISQPALDFNITGTSANPGTISAALVICNDAGEGSYLTGPAMDMRILDDYDTDHSHQFGRDVSLTLGYDPALVSNTLKLAVAWYDADEDVWIPSRSIVNESAHALTANITHLSIYAPLEDNTAPVISGLSVSRNTSSVMLAWQSSPDTDHVEIRRNGNILTNVSGITAIDSGLSGGTAYIYSLRATDFVGNTGAWNNISVTAEQIVTQISAGGGGGGGGGSGSSGEKPENIVFKDVLSVNTMKDTIAAFDFDSEMSDIRYVRYMSLKNSGKISTSIEILRDTSALAASAAPEITYRNINIWVGKTGYASEGNIKDPVIGFRVNRTWVLENSIEPSTIRLNRYSGGIWTELSTEQTGSDENCLYFEAKTPGFSPFAITGKDPALAEEGGRPEKILLELKNNTVSLTDDNPNSEKDTYGHLLPGLFIGLSGITLTAAYILRRRQQN